MPAIALETSDSIRIQLREPQWVDQAAMLLGSILTLAGLVDLAYEGIESGGAGPIAVGLFLARLGRIRSGQGNCELELSSREIILRCYSLGPFSAGIMAGHYCAGVIPWENLAEVGVVRVQLTPCLGFRLHDPRAFLNSRNQLMDGQTAKYIASNQKSVGSLTRYLSDLTGRFIGYTKLPQSNDELAILEWNRENHGYHIVCAGRPAWFFGRPYRGGPKKVAEVIRERGRASGRLTPHA
jgi:hypothetical protein